MAFDSNTRRSRSDGIARRARCAGFDVIEGPWTFDGSIWHNNWYINNISYADWSALHLTIVPRTAGVISNVSE